EADVLGQVAAHRRLPSVFASAGGINQQRLAYLNLIARLEQYIADRLDVDEGAVGAVAIEETITVGGADELGKSPRRLPIVQFDAIGTVASGPGLWAGQLELLALIHAFDDDQARQIRPPIPKVAARGPWKTSTHENYRTPPPCTVSSKTTCRHTAAGYNA